MTGSSGADYPFDPAEQERILAEGGTLPPPPTLPAMPAPGPGGSMPAARLGDMTAHFGVIGPVTTGVAGRVLIGGQPAATMGDPQVCPMFDGPKPHVGGTIVKGSATVLICNKPAARVGDPTECKGPPGTIALGCPTVLIGDAGPAGGGGGGGGSAAAPGSAAPGSGGGGGGGAGGSGSDASIDEQPPRQAGPLQPREPEPEEPTWIGIVLRDFDGTPIASERFRVTLDDGTVLSGTTDEEGYARFEDLQPGQGETLFLEIPDREEQAVDQDNDSPDTSSSESGGGAAPDQG